MCIQYYDYRQSQRRKEEVMSSDERSLGGCLGYYVDAEWISDVGFETDVASDEENLAMMDSLHRQIEIFV